MKKNLFKIINENITNNGSGFGPALNNLLLYASIINRRYISNSNLEILKDRQDIINEVYSKSIIPKIRIILESLTPNQVKMPKNNSKLIDILKVRPFEEVRTKISSTFKNQFEISSETNKALRSNRKLMKNDYIKFGFINGYLISFREKKVPMIKKKYDCLSNKLIIKDDNLINVDNNLINYCNNNDSDKINNKSFKYKKEEFENFLIKIMSNSFNYWDEYSYFNMLDKDLNEFMLADVFGMKIVDLNQSRADKRMSELVNLRGKLTMPGFNIISERFDDHRDRTNSKRPGGIHYTLTDAGLSNFPLEVQFMGIKSFIYDRYGPNAHNLYSHRDKKAQF